ncbi:MAG: ATP-binding cassette domain-containing protein, partial [Deltaproteobacteria bacterium]|nr:ATP-binding cassette domain-containing protein [Deltaproteobacteria bacterium]
VFQHYALFRHMTVFNNVAFGLRVKPITIRPSRREVRARVFELLNLVQLAAFADRYPSQLSGGQRQRVALARALSIEPQVLLLDKPFGALDAQVRKELRRWLRKLQRELSLTSLFVTHDQEEALELADRVVIMNAGRIEQAGSPQEVYDHPATPFVHQFLGSTNRLTYRIVDGRIEIDGLLVSLDGRMKLKNGPGLLFVRPHDVEIDLPGGKRLRDAIIQDVCFAGPLLNLEILHIHSGQTLTAQIHRERWESLGLRAGDGVSIRLQKVKVFPSPR